MKKIILAMVAALSAGGACAQLYVGAGLTMSQFDINCTGTHTCDTNGAGAKVYAGYVAKSGVGGEISYLQLGTAKTSATVSSTLVNSDFEGSGIAAALVLRGTITPAFFINAKLGMARVTMTEMARTSSIISPDYSESSTKPYLSFGLEYGFVESVKGTAFLDMTKGKMHGETVPMRMAGLGLEFLF